MVVGQAPPIMISPVSPPLHFSTRMCSLPGMTQNYQTVTTINSPTMSVTPVNQTTQFSSPLLTPPNTAPNSPTLSPVTCNQFPVNGNAVFTFTPVPTNSYPGVPVVPISPTLPMPCKAPDNQFSSISNIIPYSPSIYACTQPFHPSAIIPYQPRLMNGTVLQCTPGLCQFTMPAENVMGSVTSNVVYNNNLYNLPPSMSIAQTICSTNIVSPWKQSYGMEQVWRKEFDNFFYTYTRHSQHMWTLLPVSERPGGVWYENVDSAKVRFCCEACGHGWTSMKGRVAFWFILNYATNEGVVCLKLYGQQCDRCKRGDYEPAMWYPEEVQKVIVNIYNKVGQVYYGFEQAPYHKNRRAGKPRTPHNSNLCQACKDGVCAERR